MLARLSFVATVATAMVLTLGGIPAQAARPVEKPEPARPAAEKLDRDGRPVTGRAWTQQRIKDEPVAEPVWPEPATARVDLSAPAARSAASTRRARAGALPVWVGDAPGVSAARLSSVDVQVVDPAAAPPTWRDGMVMRVTAPRGANTGAAKLSVDYRGFERAYGADWASRLKLWRVPQCALTTPDAAACRSVPLPTTADTTAGTVSATVNVEQAATARAATGSFVALAAGASGSGGDFGATSLSPSSTWSAGGNSGDFSWTYPVRVPPATGPAPELSLSYSSSAVDGRSEVTNNQPSWIGEGFDYAPGYIERRYVPCAEDSKNGANSTKSSGDQCWRSENATMSLNGRGGELIFQKGKGWHNRTEDGSKIEKLDGASNGDAGDAAYGDVGEHWKVTTSDGTQYFFGLDDLPGETSDTNSTLTVPVFGNHSGEPCHASAFTSSDCKQAWRWNLDYVVDVHGNTMSFWYGRETNKYAQNATDSADVTYDRAGYLTRIDYGTYDRTQATHGVTERNTTPYAQVVFDTDMRCFLDCGTEASPKTANWKDTPWDQECKESATSCSGDYSPTFWTAKRLKSITTKVWDTSVSPARWQEVDRWTLKHTFAATADSTHTGLWLERIDHTGLVGDEAALPPVTFEAVSMANRVLTANGSTDNWLRISSIVTESGARIKVDYSEPECTAAIVKTIDPHTNTRRCYPVKVPDPNDPSGEKMVEQWWHKYVVTHVAEDDLQTPTGHPAPSKHTRYQYVGDPAWHYADDDGLSKPDRKTWGQWRGYAEVRTQVGDEPNTRTLTVTKFLRGMHGDRAAPSGGTRTVTVPASVGSETVYDEDQFAGQVREQGVFNGVDTKPVSKTVNVPWRSNPTASRTINGDTVEARYVNTAVSYSAEALGVDGSQGWRTSSGRKSLDQTYGTVNWSQNDGDIAKAGDEKCVAYTYNRNFTKNLLQTVSRTLTTALPCGTAPSSVDDVISDARSYYDGATSLTTPPTFGSVTRTEQLKDWVAGTGTVWQKVSESTYDSAGRTRSTTDIKNNVTETIYTPAVGGPVTKVVTKNPLGWTTTLHSNPYWGSTTKQYDQNNRLTADVDYDALGRVARVWQLGWTRAANPTKPNAQFEYRFAPNRDAYPYVRTQALNADGNTMTSYEIMDALMRPRQTQSMSLGGGGDRVVTDTIYDEFGRAATTYGAHAEPGAPSGTLWWEPEWSVPSVDKKIYDRAGRVTDAIFYSGDGVTNLVEQWRTVTAHEGDLVKVTPPKGGTATTKVTDIDDQVVALRQHTTAAGVNGPYVETKYFFNRKDQQVRVVDEAGNEWLSGYDAKGRLVSTTDPDKGTTLTGYNEFDELESTTDARGEKLFYTYDTIGRKKQVRDDSATGPLRAEWKYDSLYGGQTGFNGELTQAVRYEPAGSANAYRWQVRGFTARYQPTGVNYVIPEAETGLAGTYIYAYKYSDVTGAQTSMSYPAAGGLVTEELTTDYDAATGLPTRLDTTLTGSAGTMATASYTAYGERSGSIYKMPGGKWVQDVIHRDEGTRRISRTTVKRESVSGSVADRHYAYDEIGNISSIEDKPEVGTAEKQCFRNDPLGRLTTAWTPRTTVDCKTDPAVADLGGPAPYWQDWTFDVTGNRLTETSHVAAGNTLREYAVPQGGKDVARPHAVTGMTTTAPGQAATTTEYRYDNSGNMVCRPAAGGTGNDCDTNANSQTLSWDAEGELAAVTAGSTTVESNLYDADGDRLIRRDAGGTTLYLPGQEVRRQGSTTIGTRYYTFAGTICGSRQASSAINDLTWLFTDHQGTQQIAVNAGTQAVTIRRQTPYGASRGAGTAWVNGKGFVGGDNDPSGLVNIGARRYDMALGRFISVDPVMDLADPQQWNAYSYAYNSPISHADPSGEDPCPGGGGGCYYDGTTTRHDGVTKEQMDRGMELSRKYTAEIKRKKTVERQTEQANQQRAAQERERKHKECQASFWCRSKQKAKSIGSAGMDFMAKHADVVGVVAGVGVGLACTALTGGGGAVLCGALGGAVTGLVTAGLECYGGDESKCGVGNLATEAAIGAGLGALGGGVGAVGGGLLKGGLSGARSAVTSLPKQTLGAVREILPQKASVAIGGHAKANASSFIRATRSTWGLDVSRAGGGALGHLKVAGSTVGLVIKGGFSAEGIAGGVVGGLAPTTKDDLSEFMSKGPSWHPINTPVQIFGGFAGGAFP
ncbi:RHS repeat-associated core domain-containing protein [Actinoplanes sp. NPDC049802]|uniref:RHS repeat-associated core domain-containing protein n=1 Tax=Actinoplanes sp. NPDC049802 TaxID=3154742 RepID=UPI0033DBFFB3